MLLTVNHASLYNKIHEQLKPFAIAVIKSKILGSS